MNKRRAGLYSFASTTTWLHKTGMASPPFLVLLGLTLPDSRILSGIASIGLTLANIAVILPHLRQRMLDSMHARECALADEQSTKEPINSSDGSNATQPVDPTVESPSTPSLSPCDREQQSLPLACSATLKSACSAATEPLECLDVDSEIAPQTILLLPAGKTDEISPQIYRSPDVDYNEKHVSSSYLLARAGRGPLHIPLPVPDAAEVAFFDTSDANLSDRDVGEEYLVAPCEQYTTPEEGMNGPIARKGAEQGGSPIGRQRVATDQPIADENVAPAPTKVSFRDHHNPVAESTASRLPDGLAIRGGNVQRAQTGHSLVGGKEVLTKRRPESLEFIPQSVIRRYHSAPMASAGRCLGHRAFISEHDHPVTQTSPHILVHNPTMLPEGTRPRASHATLEWHGRTSFPTEVPPRRSMGGQIFVIETAPAQDPLQQGLASLPEPSAVHELTPLRKYPTHRRRLGVLARAALRNRRSIAHRCRNDAIDCSSTSDSDSEWDSDSQYSSGSSADESMLPHMLGADLIAAIDANSESELNLVESRRKMCTPLDVYEDFLVSEDSAADVSMVMHVSSIDDASDSGVRAPATSRPLTYEDIQQWASGVVQKCVRQVCRSRAPAEPLSPSQASDVCAERPSGPGISKCPLSDLHCKLGAAALTEVAAPRTRNLPVPLPPTSILPTRKPLSVRNLHDIPEFVPRQRHVSVIAGREGSRRFNTISTIDVTRDAATEVIARMETQAGFNTRQRLVGMDEKQMTVSTAGGRQGTLKWA